MRPKISPRDAPDSVEPNFSIAVLFWSASYALIESSLPWIWHQPSSPLHQPFHQRRNDQGVVRNVRRKIGFLDIAFQHLVHVNFNAAIFDFSHCTGYNRALTDTFHRTFVWVVGQLLDTKPTRSLSASISRICALTLSITLVELLQHVFGLIFP